MCNTVPNGYRRHGNSYYALYGPFDGRGDARQQCHSDNAIIAEMTNAEKVWAVFAYMCKFLKNNNYTILYTFLKNYIFMCFRLILPE